MTERHELELFFDGECPLCAREIALARALDRRGKVRFTDIADPRFDPSRVGRSIDELMAQIHGRTPDGRWVVGVEAFRALYTSVGFRRVVGLTRFAPIDWLLERAYAVFARNRLTWTGRCTDGSCSVPRRASRVGAVGALD